MAEHLSMLAAAVDGLLDAGLAELSDSELVEVMRGVEQSLRRAETVSHRLVVESVERSAPASLGYTSPRKLLIDVLRISGADASARVAAARELGVWHTLAGDPMPPVLPETAAAQADGDIGTDHVRAITKAMRKIPHAVGNEAVAGAEAVLATLARSGTPEDVEQAGHRLLAYLNPDGSLGDDRDRKRRRGISIGRQDTDPDTLVVDEEATALTRARLRQDRLERGKPYSEFGKEFVTPEPPKDLLYYGSWGDDTDKLTATYFTVNGPERVESTVEDMPIIMMPDARDLKVAALEQRVRELEDKHGEQVNRKS
ncbi:DUF222 domain-containing protein [Rhodococcus opacus]|uniref:DUF222 domain-containing protein n=1 Tax=Rhodococcus opacus TaxID=37919 RepID=UPI00200C95BC|nr:DUF222 domain-containing protein [Rhodococcus opacus]